MYPGDVVRNYWNTQTCESFTSFSDGTIIGIFNRSGDGGTSVQGNLQRAKSVLGRSQRNAINFVDEVQAFEHSFVPGSDDDPISKNHQHKHKSKHTVKRPPAYREAEYSQTSHLHYYLRDKVQKNQFNVAQDPREALLKYTQDKDSTYYLAAYNKTQPNPIFTNAADSDDDSPVKQREKQPKI
uniref:Uncharacterized protein n=1 Tax=Lygus hesperus TaxID=30085 RepID=A0A0A9YI48_LYGHE